MKFLPGPVLALSLSLPAQAAAPFTTARLLEAAALLPAPREEIFFTPQGKPDWMFAESANRITPAVAGTIAVAEGRFEFTLGKEGALIGWGNDEGRQPLAERVHLTAGRALLK